jgi:GNAT superfamily N-acetyltransferase
MSAERYRIAYLADYPQYVEACAAWNFGRWGVGSPNSSLAETLRVFEKSTHKEALPLTFIAINNDNDQPVAMGSLWGQDGDEWPDVSPWIASIFVHNRHRRSGLATRLVIRLEEEAKQLGFDTLYLKAGAAAPLYEKIGYSYVDSVKSDLTSTGKITLYTKTLN